MSKETRLAVRESRIQHWTKIFEDRINSGHSTKEYCNIHGISKDQYYYWLRKVREAALEENRIQFVEIKDAPAVLPEIEFKGVLSVRIKDAVIEIDESASQVLIEKTIRALRNA